MNWMTKLLLQQYFLLSPDPAPGGGGAPPATPPVDHSKDIADLKAQNAALLERLDKMSKPAPDDPSLKEKADKEKIDKEKQTADTKAIESAVRFSMGAGDFLKNNESLLPKEVKDIFTQADKKNYATPVEKANDIKVGIIETFFGLQANLDLLTVDQKDLVVNFLGSIQTRKQEKAAEIFGLAFEPAMKMLTGIKKAGEVAKAKQGQGNASDADKAYQEKLMGISKKHYLNDKGEK